MKAFELTTQIDEQGTLHLPSDCKPVFGKQARVIVLVEEPEAAANDDKLTRLETFAGVLKDSPQSLFPQKKLDQK